MYSYILSAAHLPRHPATQGLRRSLSLSLSLCLSNGKEGLVAPRCIVAISPPKRCSQDRRLRRSYNGGLVQTAAGLGIFDEAPSEMHRADAPAIQDHLLAFEIARQAGAEGRVTVVLDAHTPTRTRTHARASAHACAHPTTRHGKKNYLFLFNFLGWSIGQPRKLKSRISGCREFVHRFRARAQRTQH